MKIGQEREKWKPRLRHRHLILFTLLWVLFALYPNPLQLARSLQRVLNPPIDAARVEVLAAEAPEHPKEIEAYVLQAFPYQYDWQTYGMPWYFPTLEEAMEKETGDCKTRFVVLASVFEAKDISYQLSFSLSHFWVHYEGKEENSWELEQNAFMVRNEDGSLQLQVPREEQQQIRQNFIDGFWRAMPPFRKRILLAGPMVAVGAGIILTVREKRRKTPLRQVAVDA